MLQRLYIHNFKSFQNFELKPEGKHSGLLVGKNGARKSSITKAILERLELDGHTVFVREQAQVSLRKAPPT